jgi:hypothetical protein
MDSFFFSCWTATSLRVQLWTDVAFLHLQFLSEAS